MGCTLLRANSTCDPANFLPVKGKLLYLHYSFSQKDWRCSARFRGWSGAGSGPKSMPGWFHPGSLDCCIDGDKEAAVLAYASSAKRTASTRPGPFLGTVFFFERGLMMLIAEASSCVFKCAA